MLQIPIIPGVLGRAATHREVSCVFNFPGFSSAQGLLCPLQKASIKIRKTKEDFSRAIVHSPRAGMRRHHSFLPCLGMFITQCRVFDPE